MSDEVKPDRRMLEALVCPLTQAPLSYDAEAQELISKPARLAYPIRGGIPVMLIDEARRLE
ncbi:MAG: Trm112 family protein [Rhodobacteraceae bacterium]|nr:Trm112 family protein [Paracoccaceae bacterium]